MESSVQFAALRRHAAPLTFTDYWAPINVSVGQLAAHRPQVALPRRLPMDCAFPMNGGVGQLAARQPQVAFPRRLPLDRRLMAMK